MDISVVIPLFNEEESIPELFAWIERVMGSNGFTYEVIFVNDGSTDRSWQIIEELQEKNSCVKGIKFRRNYGKSPALYCGFKKAEGDVVITMDADLQDSPDEIPELYRMIMTDGFDLVSGYKQKRYDPLSKTIPTKLFNATARKVSWSMDATTSAVYITTEFNKCYVHCTDKFDESITLTASIDSAHLSATATVSYIGVPVDFEIVYDFDSTSAITLGELAQVHIVEYDYFGYEYSGSAVKDTYTISALSSSSEVTLGVDMPSEAISTDEKATYDAFVKATLFSEATYTDSHIVGGSVTVVCGENCFDITVDENGIVTIDTENVAHVFSAYISTSISLGNTSELPGYINIYKAENAVVTFNITSATVGTTKEVSFLIKV